MVTLALGSDRESSIFLSLCQSAQGAAGVGMASKVLVCTGIAEQAQGSQADTEMETLAFPQEPCSSRPAPTCPSVRDRCLLLLETIYIDVSSSYIYIL